MDKNTKITLSELIARKEQMLDSKKNKKTKDLYINSLDGIITIDAPTGQIAKEAQDMTDGDEYVVYQCVIEPNLKNKELRDAYGCIEPMEIVKKIFDPGEIPQIAMECIKLAGYVDSVKAVDEVKN